MQHVGSFSFGMQDLFFFLFISACTNFSCGMWDLVPWPGIEPGPPEFRVWSLSHWTISCCSVAHSCLTLFNPMDCNMSGFSVLYHLPEFAQRVHWIGDAIQPSHPLASPSPPAFNLSQHQGLFQWVRSLHLVANVSEHQFQHQSFQRIFRINFL